MNSSKPVVQLEDVCKEYMLGTQKVQAVRNVSLNVERGVFLAIAGPSGSGKSTLLNMIGCIDSATSGKVIINGHSVAGKTPNQLAELRARTIGFVFQTFNLLPVLSAAENIEYPLLQFDELTKKQRKDRVSEFLELVQLTKYAKHRPNELSGGQRQRVAIARALATQPEIVLADEPTANLDHATGEVILQLMKDLNRRFKTTFIFSTHDRKVMSKADRLVWVQDGQIKLLGVRTPTKWALIDRRKVGQSVDAKAPTTKEMP